MMTSERGSATLSVAGVCVALSVVATLALALGLEVIAVHRAQDSVDRAALAASDVLHGVAAGEPCDMALHILRQEEVSLRSCELESGGVRLEVVVPTTLGDTVVRARAMVINGGVKTNVVYRDPR